MTGVFDIPNDMQPVLKDEDQMYNIWITTVFDMNGNPMNGKITFGEVHGIAILMNNFISKDISTSKQYIDEICGENVCVDTLTNKFNEKSGEVRCCKLTKTILKYFWGDDNVIPQFELLNIQDITYRRPPV